MSTTHAPSSQPRSETKAAFGSSFASELVAAEYVDGKWSELRIEDYAPLSLDPATTCLHYGQTIFEGLKGHRQPDGDTAIFRLRDHMERFNRSAARMSMPSMDPALAAQAIIELVSRQSDLTPEPPGSLYIRPMMIATAVGMGVKPSSRYRYMVLLTPVQSYFGGKVGIRMRTEERWTRASPGGTGYAKCGGNYGASMIAQEAAVSAGFDQVLWLDAHAHTYIEELSAMNFLMVDDGVLVSPPESETVLPSITNRSIFTLAEDLGIPSERRTIPISRLSSDSISEVFCCGTAAIITPVFEVWHQGSAVFSTEERTRPGPVASSLYEALTSVQQGTADDPHGWRTPVGAVTP